MNDTQIVVELKKIKSEVSGIWWIIWIVAFGLPLIKDCGPPQFLKPYLKPEFTELCRRGVESAAINYR